jgi:hypothetical protein
VPINALVAVAGTPLEGSPPVEALELVRWFLLQVYEILNDVHVSDKLLAVGWCLC